MLMVSITDVQWDKWGQPGGWTAWELDTQPEHFCPNLAVVLCKGVFDDTTDPGLMGKVCHYMTIAQVPDCIELLPFNQVREAFNRYNETTTGVGLVRLHQSNEVFPDVYFQYYSEHFMIMGLSDPEIRVWHGQRVCGRLPGAPVRGSERLEGTCYASPWLHAGGHLSNSLSHVHVPPSWYRISGTTSAHPRHLPGSEGKVHSKPGEILHCRSSSHRVAI